jgi:hypothetical protein
MVPGSLVLRNLEGSAEALQGICAEGSIYPYCNTRDRQFELRDDGEDS